VVTTALLVVPLLLAYQRRTAPGLATTLVTMVALLPVVTYEFPRPQTSGMVAAIAAAAVADGILLWLDRRRGLDAPLRLPVAGAVFAGLVSAGHLLGLHLDTGIRWPVELWTGSVMSAVLAAALLGVLAARTGWRR
jgi:hypothetical protein